MHPGIRPGFPRIPFLSLSKEALNKSPCTSWRRIFHLALPEKLEIHKVFLRFSGFASRKIRSPIRTLQFNQRFPNLPLELGLRMNLTKQLTEAIVAVGKHVEQETY